VTGLSRFGFFQKAVGLRLEDAEFDAHSVKTIDYLDFLSGRFRDDTLRDQLAAALPGLGRGAGTAVSAGVGAPSERAPTAADERRMGDFIIEAELGRGAMGIVYRATQISLGRKVALKVLPPVLVEDPVALGRFHREVQALGRCDHPNVVRILASGVEAGRPWYAMELVRGADLSTVFDIIVGWKGKKAVLKAGHLGAASSSYCAPLLPAPMQQRARIARLTSVSSMSPKPATASMTSMTDPRHRRSPGS
jgi:hypothetical protein